MAVGLLQRRRTGTRESRPESRHNGRVPAYQRLAVCLSPGAADTAVSMACDLAADRGARLTAIAVIEVPPEVPLETPDRDVEEAAREAVRTAQALASAHQIDTVGTVLHARHAGEAIVDELTARRVEVVILADAWPQSRGSMDLSATTRYVLKHAPCRVMLVRGVAAPSTNGSERRETVFRSSRPTHGNWPTGEFIEPV